MQYSKYNYIYHKVMEYAITAISHCIYIKLTLCTFSVFYTENCHITGNHCLFSAHTFVTMCTSRYKKIKIYSLSTCILNEHFSSKYIIKLIFLAGKTTFIYGNTSWVFLNRTFCSFPVIQKIAFLNIASFVTFCNKQNSAVCMNHG